jgi:hypothetical protein
MQTSIEMIIEEVKRLSNLYENKVPSVLLFETLFEAKKIHKQEIINAVNSISVECEHYDEHKWNYENGEQYYKETFGSKESYKTKTTYSYTIQQCPGYEGHTPKSLNHQVCKWCGSIKYYH